MSVLASYIGGRAARANKNAMAAMVGQPEGHSPGDGHGHGADFDFSPYVTEGGARPDAISGLDDGFSGSLAAMIAAAPEGIREQLQIGSDYRSPERQEELWQAAVAKYGSESAARKWVAPPGKSQHNHGRAADLKFLSPEAKAWVHENAGQYGLHFPMSWEPWHIEPIGARANPMATYAGM